MLPALLLLIVFFLLPVLSLLLRSVLDPSPGLQNYAQLFGSTTYLRVFGNTFFVASVVTAVTLVIGFPTAWLLAIAPRWVSKLRVRDPAALDVDQPARTHLRLDGAAAADRSDQPPADVARRDS